MMGKKTKEINKIIGESSYKMGFREQIAYLNGIVENCNELLNEAYSDYQEEYPEDWNDDTTIKKVITKYDEP